MFKTLNTVKMSILLKFIYRANKIPQNLSTESIKIPVSFYFFYKYLQAAPKIQMEI